MDNWHYLTRNWYTLPKAIFRLCFIILNNAYAIPTYVVWMVLLSPLRKVNPDVYWKIEGLFFHWLLAMVSMWSWSAGYDIVEAGDDITDCVEDRTLVIANHQSTGDVPMLMACFNAKKHVLPNLMWIMDRLFKFTNFGIVSVIHQDFFIMSGKDKRDKSLRELVEHLLNSYIPRKRRWIVLFPEGGFLRKRKAVSQQFAKKNNLPLLEHVTLPRVGALQVIMNTVGPIDPKPLKNMTTVANNNSTCMASCKDIKTTKLKWILDITIAYPNGDPIDLGTIVFGQRPPCKTIVFYRVYSSSSVPQDGEEMKEWLFARWQEKEAILKEYYTTGIFPENKSPNPIPSQVVNQDLLRFILLHIFLITSMYLHIQMFSAAYHYCSYLID